MSGSVSGGKSSTKVGDVQEAAHDAVEDAEDAKQGGGAALEEAVVPKTGQWCFARFALRCTFSALASACIPIAALAEWAAVRAKCDSNPLMVLCS